MTQAKTTDPRLVVALGASAGGLDAFTAFFSTMPMNTGMAFILLPHLAPDHPSVMASLLSNTTSLKITDIVDNSPIEANNIYILPAGKQLHIKNKRLQLEPIDGPRDKWMVVDQFFVSLASEYGTRAVAVILSGTGTHGVSGFLDVKSAGGLLIAQDPFTAQYDQMPQSAIATGLVDMVLAPKKMAQALLKYKKHPYLLKNQDNNYQQKLDNEILAILELLKSNVKYDFSGYRKNMLFRRVSRRMGIVGVAKMDKYLAYLEQHPEEINELHKDLMIGVTTFFRDAQAFSLLGKEILPELVKSTQNDKPLRVWIPACSTGEEAYSIGMLLIEQFERLQKPISMQLFASDIDTEALQKARKGIYDKNDLENITPERLNRFFTATPDQGFQVNKLLRDHILFAGQNLIGDAPFSRLDLISCRNLLIYLQPELQRKVIHLFHFALKPGGYLFLGPSESVGKHEDLFQVVSKKWRLYKSIGMTNHQAFSLPLEKDSAGSALNLNISKGDIVQPHSLSKFSGLLQRALLDAYAPAAVLINSNYQILQFHGPTVNFLEFPKGSPSYDLMSLLRDGLRTRVRTAVQKAIEKNEVIVDRKARVKIQSHYKPCLLTVRPITESLATERAYLITFEDKPIIDINTIEDTKESTTLSAPNGHEKLEVIEQLEYELNSTRDDLRSTVLELESSNQDLKISNEEVMSMNEELQSANEELETSKEELQSMNEELNSVNVELLWKVEQLEQSNNDVQNLLRSTNIATVFLDRDMHIKLFNPAIKSLMNLQDEDIGRKISDFSTKVADTSLINDTKQVLDKLAPVSTEVHLKNHNEIVKSYLRTIVPYRTTDNRVDGVVITFVEITELHQQRNSLHHLYKAGNTILKAEQERLNSIMDAAFEGIIVISLDGTITESNVSAEKTFLYSQNELIGNTIMQLVEKDERPRLKEHLTRVYNERRKLPPTLPVELLGSKNDNSLFPMELNISAIDHTGQLVATVRDLTEQKALQREVMEVVSHEQEKIGIELHDSLGQKLTGISLLARNMKGVLDTDASHQQEAIDEILLQLKLSIGDIRQICHGLAPLSITQEGLPYAFESMLKPLKNDKIDIQFTVSKDFEIKDRSTAIEFYRIAQGALSNTIKHASASKITLELCMENKHPKMVFTDNGKGFNKDALVEHDGIGLKVMKYRASAIGAKLTLDSSPNRGTRICCCY